MKPALTAEEIGNLVASDASTIGLMIAKAYRSGPEGVALARDIRDIVLALRSSPAVDGVGEPVAWMAKSYSRPDWVYGETAEAACELACRNNEEVVESIIPLYIRSALSPTSDRASVVEECAKVADAEEALRLHNGSLADAGDTSWGIDTQAAATAQYHKAITAKSIAASIRRLALSKEGEAS